MEGEAEGVAGCTQPAIAFTAVPPYGSDEPLRGKVNCRNPQRLWVAVYIFAGGWWIKPTLSAPLTPVAANSTWAADITTGPFDPCATQVAAFLLPPHVAPPLLQGAQTLPAPLFSSALGSAIAARTYPRSVRFAGRTWHVRSCAAGALGPGPNHFSDAPEDVFVDANGNLHLRIVRRGTQWFSTEVVAEAPSRLGYGSYTFVLGSRVDLLDKNVVLGLFTWEDGAPKQNNREIDIEFSRWGEAGAPNAQYVVQPFDRAGNRQRFSFQQSGSSSWHRFTWKSGSVNFASWNGPPTRAPAMAWRCTSGDVPQPGGEQVRINLWLLNGQPPSDGKSVEVIVHAFSHTPT